MALTVFISYDYTVNHLVNSLYSVLKQNGIDVYAIESEYEREQKIRLDIQNMMRSSDCIFFFLTNHSINQQNTWIEVGMAKATHKPLLFIIEHGLSLPKGVSRENDIVIYWNYTNLDDIINQISNYSLQLKSEKEKGNSIYGILVLLGALAFVASLTSDEDKEG